MYLKKIPSSFGFLKQLQLLRLRWQFFAFSSPKVDDSAVLLVCNHNDTNMSFRRHPFFQASNMHSCTLPASAVSNVNRILMHGKAIFKQLFSVLCISLPVLFTYGRQIECCEKPHNAISLYPSITGRSRFLVFLSKHFTSELQVN